MKTSAGHEHAAYVHSREPMNRTKEKKRIRKIGSVLLALLCVGFFSFSVCADGTETVTDPLSEYSGGGVQLRLDYGYRNTAKTGQMLPVTITVENNTGDTIDGFLSVDIPGEEGSISYTTSIKIPEGTTVLKRTVTIPDGITRADGDRLEARLFDDSGAEIASAGTTVTYIGTGREVLCGILSDDQQNLLYLGNVSLGDDLSTRIVTLNPADLPDSEDGLNQLDIIVISSVDLNRLNEFSVQAVMAWVENGGTLIMGTGGILSPLGAFRSLIGNPELGLARNRNVDMGMQYSTSGPDGAVLSLKLREILWDSAKTIRESGENDLVLRRTFGKGSVCLAAFDLCEIKAFGSEHPDFVQALLTDAVGQTGLARISGSLLSAEERLTASREMTNTYDGSKIPGIARFVIGAVLFLLLAGAVLYRLLQIRGLGVYYMLGVLIVSMAFALVFWMAGSSTRISGPFIRYGTITEFSLSEKGDTRVSMQGYIDLESNSESAVTLELPEDCMVRPVITGGAISITAGKKKMLAVTGQKQFETNIFRVEQKIESAEVTPPLSVELASGADGLSGTVTNISESPVSGAALIRRGEICILGTLKPGESRSFGSGSSLRGPMLLPGLAASAMAEAEKDVPLSLQRDSLRSSYLRESVSLSEGKLLLLGFADEHRPSFLDRTSYEIEGSDMFVLELTEPAVSNGESFRRIPASEPKVISGSFDPATGCLKGSGAAVLEYSLGSGYQLTAIELCPLSTELEGKGVTAFSGQIAMYNYSSGSYDLMDAGKKTWQAGELKNYLSPANNLNVRYLPDEDRKGNLPVCLPQLYVHGSVTERKTDGIMPGSQTDAEALPGGPTDAGT